MISKEQETRLVAELRSGNRVRRDAALQELYELLAPQVFALCLRVACDRGDAEDALQETFVAVLGAIGGFRGEARLSSWVLRIAIHASTRMRSRRRSRPKSGLPQELEETWICEHPDPLTLATSKEQLERLLDRISGLPAAQRVVLALSAIEGLDRSEIAAVLGIPIGTVDSRLHAARQSLIARSRSARS